MFRYFLLGTGFGVVLVKSEVISWFRMQEMFRFQSFHMYAVLLSAVVTAGLSIVLLRRMGARTLAGDPIVIPPKVLGTGRRYWMGGTVFGFGWALSGACPGPLFAVAGTGLTVYAAAALAAVAGTWSYGYFRPRLPH
jgi:uncharacterized membrane protein YedE/YeeE